jgi:uncharacterized protein YqiB (DUF1249 family)
MKKAMTHEETNYKNLMKIVPNLLDPAFEYRKLEASGFMPLHVDLLYGTPEKLTIALAHNYRHPSGDIIADPDMELLVYPLQGRVKASAYQDAFGYYRVYSDSNEVNPQAYKNANQFLGQWLRNLIEQGHK